MDSPSLAHIILATVTPLVEQCIDTPVARTSTSLDEDVTSASIVLQFETILSFFLIKCLDTDWRPAEAAGDGGLSTFLQGSGLGDKLSLITGSRDPVRQIQTMQGGQRVQSS
ncbi:hypothetical protein E4U24_006060 [Claviceps purpurea]|nr:hypothetical protein E4U24_006060 [Claviceps purpurea]